MEERPNVQLPMRGIIIALAVVIGGFVIISFSSQFMYFFELVDEQEVGVQFQSGRITDVVGPGVYSDFGLFVKIERVSSQAVPFVVTDEELITQDKQRIGLVVTGDIFRPGLAQKDDIQRLWPQYQQLYLNDETVRLRTQDRAKQAMKVCVGNRIFDDAVIGSARDELRACIDEEVNKLASNFGLRVDNVAVPDVIILPEVQARLDEIVQSRLQTEKAAQDELKVKAQALAEQARQEGEIRIAQSRIQEESRGQKLLAELEEEKIQSQRAVIEAERANELARVEAQRAIIEAEKANELLAAEKDLEIQTIAAQAAAERAKAEVAKEMAVAEIYTLHPEYGDFQIARENASALSSTDKLIFGQEGLAPTLVIPGPGISSMLDATADGTAVSE
ncbi:MAG: SPFH domain-containing protein [Chloroflexota bacterium]